MVVLLAHLLHHPDTALNIDLVEVEVCSLHFIELDILRYQFIEAIAEDVSREHP